MGTLTAQRWGDMRHDVTRVWRPWQMQYFRDQHAFEKKAAVLLKENPAQAIDMMTKFSIEQGGAVVKRAWQLGDELWTRYDEKF